MTNDDRAIHLIATENQVWGNVLYARGRWFMDKGLYRLTSNPNRVTCLQCKRSKRFQILKETTK